MYAVCYSMGKKFFYRHSPTSSYLRPKCVHEIFFKMNLHPEGFIFGYFDFKHGFPYLKTPWYQFSCIQLP